MIQTFADRATAEIFVRQWVRHLAAVQGRAYAKLLVIDRVQQVEELRSPPGNRLEKLTGRRAGQWSIRINDQWRLCFEWRNGHAWNVEIVDYH